MLVWGLSHPAWRVCLRVGSGRHAWVWVASLPWSHTLSAGGRCVIVFSQESLVLLFFFLWLVVSVSGCHRWQLFSPKWCDSNRWEPFCVSGECQWGGGMSWSHGRPPGGPPGSSVAPLLAPVTWPLNRPLADLGWSVAEDVPVVDGPVSVAVPERGNRTGLVIDLINKPAGCSAELRCFCWSGGQRHSSCGLERKEKEGKSVPQARISRLHTTACKFWIA